MNTLWIRRIKVVRCCREIKVQWEDKDSLRLTHIDQSLIKEAMEL